jgi:formamidopyrimidine-DNA glycosylase
MPELPEVETVRAGIDRWIVGRTIADVEVRHPRAVRRHPAGASDFTSRLAGARVLAAQRRGKFLWLVLPDDLCVVIHLGMSGQVLVQPAGSDDEKHLHVRFRFTDGGPQMRFVDQRTFGGMLLDALVPTGAGDAVPASVAHISRDPIDQLFDVADFSRRLRRRDSALKRCLLDQTLVSGIGNIYADEALWRAQLNGLKPARTLTNQQVMGLMGHVGDVLGAALVAGGTSFDALYVNVNGQSGYFDRSLNAYGQDGRPCPRCGTAIRRVAFMNRSSFFCPRCQRPPRARAA